jgi:hypothetical protein
LVVENLPLEPLPGLKAGEKMSASDMRQALIDGNLKKFKTFLPEDSQDRAEYIFTRILGGEPADQPEEEEPLAESFRADDLYGLIDEIIEEISSSGGSSMQSGAMSRSGKGPWTDLDTEEENEKQRKSQKLKGDKEDLVGEILNYLVNKEAVL